MTVENEKKSYCQTNPGRAKTLVLITATVLLAAFVSIGATTVSANGDIVSDFDNDAEAWTVVGDAQTLLSERSSIPVPSESSEVTPAAGDTEVSLEPASISIDPGETRTVDLVVDSADGGVGGLDGSIDVNDTNVVEITDANLKHSSIGSASVSSDGSSVDIDFFGMDTAQTGTVDVVEMTVEGQGSGSATLSPNLTFAHDENGLAYTLTGENDASVTVGSGMGGEVVSEFDNDAEGWTVVGDAQGGTTPMWEGTGGNPGGHIVADDSVAGGTWYWNASSEFLGDKSGSYDGTLEYDLRVSSTSSQFDNSDIVLEGGGTTLIYDHGDESTHPGTDWTEYEVALNESDDGWTNENTGSTPTQSEFESVLSSLSSLQIRGEYRSGSDTGRLDNVVLSGDDSGGSIDSIQITLSDTDGDSLPDQVQADVTVSDVGTGQTIVELGETNFDVDVSPTDTTDGGQAQFVSEKDPDSDGTPEAVEFVSLGTVSATYTVLADLSNQEIGETGTVNVELGSGVTDSETYTVEESTGPLDPNNPFGDSGNNPADRATVIQRIVEWNLNGSIDGTPYTRSEIIGFIVQWNLAQ